MEEMDTKRGGNAATDDPEYREKRRTIQDWKMQLNRTNVGGEDRTRHEKGSIIQYSKLYPRRALAMHLRREKVDKTRPLQVSNLFSSILNSHPQA